MQGGGATNNVDQTYLDVVAFGHTTKILSEKSTEPKIDSLCTRTVELLDQLVSRNFFKFRALRYLNQRRWKVLIQNSNLVDNLFNCILYTIACSPILH